MTRLVLLRSPVLFGVLLCGLSLPALAIDSSLTYQGRLTDSTVGGPATGSYDLQFALQDTGGGAIGAPILVDNVNVVGGVFTVRLDFGPTAFSGPDRFLQIGVRRGDESGAFTALSPRSAITPAPYAQTSTAAEFAATVANNSIGSTQIINASVGDVDVDASMQRRVAGSCPSGSAIATISASGSVTCETTATSAAAGSIIPFASGADGYFITTAADGSEGVGLMMGFGGADTTNGDIGFGVIDISSDGNLAFMMPVNGTLSSVSFHVTTTNNLMLIGTAITLQAKIYQASIGNTFLPIPGTLVVGNPQLTGILAAGTVAQGTLSGLSIPVAAGDRLLLVISAQANSGPLMTNTIGLRVSGGIGIQ